MIIQNFKYFCTFSVLSLSKSFQHGLLLFVFLFIGISTFMGYLMPKIFL